MEDIVYTSRDTYDEVERPSSCIETAANKCLPHTGTDPRLKYTHSLALSLEVYHSSFGSEIIFQSPREDLQRGSYESSLSAPQSKSGQNFCYVSTWNATCNGDKTGPAEETSGGSWMDSTILRAVWHGAKVQLLRMQITFSCLIFVNLVLLTKVYGTFLEHAQK